ncbi:hypothetical protein ACFWZW_02785 [Microbacterium enclense]|uniref:hypothetical protein n=1 Tax=Microbacterium enclense TaxID=993073 RepID=UPI0036D90EBF
MRVVGTEDVPQVRIDPLVLSAEAAELRGSATAADEANDELVSTWAGLTGDYDAPEAADLLVRMTPVTEAVAEVALTFTTVADVLDRLAETLASAQGTASLLSEEVADFARLAARRSGEIEEYPWTPGERERNLELLAGCVAVQQSIDTAVDEARSDLSRIADPPFTFDSAPDAGPASPSTAVAQHARLTNDVAEGILEALASLPPDGMRELLAAHPDWVRLFGSRDVDPGRIAAWWAARAAADPEAVAALTVGAATIVGSLPGAPVEARLRANREKAAARIADIDAEVARIQARIDRHASPDLRRVPHRGPDDWQADIDALQRERDYLERARAGEVQLYLYEPESRSVIEMMGTLSEATTDVVTYVPGTFTGVADFHTGAVQQVGRRLATGGDIVTFVWKEGVFPGEGDRGADYWRILEAADEPTALEKGSDIARFQREIDASSPLIAAAQKDAIGHSWGLAALTSAETAGARFDQVHSLAGAGMPTQWHPREGTVYHHWAYTDLLTMGQQTGLIWNGKIPGTESAFTSHVFSREGDFKISMPVPGEPGLYPPPDLVPFEGTTHLLENHNLIASDDPENEDVLQLLQRELHDR